MPARFYKAVVTRQDGVALGTFATGSGLEAAAVLRDMPGAGIGVRND